MSNRDGEVGFIPGRRGSGKSVFAQQIAKSKDRILVLDPKRSGSWKTFAARNGFYHAQTAAEVWEVLRDNWDGTFKILYFPSIEEQGAKELSSISKCLMAIQEDYLAGKADKKLHLMVDELHMLDPNPPAYKKTGRGFVELMTMGRESGIDVTAISQRPQFVSMMYRDCVDWVAAFKVAGVDPAKAIKGVCDDADDVYTALMKLNKYEHVWYSNGEHKVYPPLKL